MRITYSCFTIFQIMLLKCLLQNHCGLYASRGGCFAFLVALIIPVWDSIQSGRRKTKEGEESWISLADFTQDKRERNLSSCVARAGMFWISRRKGLPNLLTKDWKQIHHDLFGGCADGGGRHVGGVGVGGAGARQAVPGQRQRYLVAKW